MSIKNALTNDDEKSWMDYYVNSLTANTITVGTDILYPPITARNSEYSGLITVASMSAEITAVTLTRATVTLLRGPEPVYTFTGCGHMDFATTPAVSAEITFLITPAAAPQLLLASEFPSGFGEYFCQGTASISNPECTGTGIQSINNQYQFKVTTQLAASSSGSNVIWGFTFNVYGV